MKGAKTEAEFLQDHPAFQQRHRFAPLLDQGELFIAFPVSLEPFDSHDPRHRVKLEGIVRHLMAIGLPNYAAVDEAMNYFAKEEEDGTDVATETGSRDD